MPRRLPSHRRSVQPSNQVNGNKKRESIADHVREAIVVSDVTENANAVGRQRSGLLTKNWKLGLAKFDHSIGGS